jgi:phosphoketolase
MWVEFLHKPLLLNRNNILMVQHLLINYAKLMLWIYVQHQQSNELQLDGHVARILNEKLIKILVVGRLLTSREKTTWET